MRAGVALRPASIWPSLSTANAAIRSASFSRPAVALRKAVPARGKLVRRPSAIVCALKSDLRPYDLAFLTVTPAARNSA